VPLKAGDYVLVLGLGGVSTYVSLSAKIVALTHPLCFSWALQFAVASGATVIATSSSDEKLKIAASLGAKYLINYKKTPNWDEEVLNIVRIKICVAELKIHLFLPQTNGVGVDHVIEVCVTCALQ